MEKAKTFNVAVIVVILITALMTSVWADAPAQDAQAEYGLYAAPASRNAGQGRTLPSAVNAPVSFELDDGSVENNLGVNEPDNGPATQFIWFNRFTPNPSEFPFDLQQIQVFFDDVANGVSAGAAIHLVVYQDADGNPANGASVLATVPETVKVVDGTNWSVYNLSSPVRITGPGDVYIGVINRFVNSGVTPENYPAALDEGVSQGRSWIGWWDGVDPPNPAVLPPDDVFTVLDSAGFPGNWMIRGYGETVTWTSRSYVPIATVNGGGCPSGTLQPNDPGFSQQWGMSKIDLPRAWFCGSQGDSSVVAAVIDTGVDKDHVEFAGKLVPGWDFANNDNDADDDHGHGTNVAGIVGAIGNNGVGVAGVAWDTSIMPLKTLRGDGAGLTSWSAQAVGWAVSHGADVINMSLGGVNSSQTFQNAVNAAHAAGVLVVASAGNCGDQYYPYNGCSVQDQTSYPGAYSNVLAVASTTQSDQQSSFSTQGFYVDIAAPGSFIYSTVVGGYDSMSGTSQAAPHVAGLAAVIKAAYPQRSPDQIAAAMQNSAVDLGAAGRDDQFGSGRIDAPAALSLAARDFTALSSADAGVAPLMRDSGAEIAPGVVLVKFLSGVNTQTASTVLDNVDPSISVVDTLARIGVLKLSVPAGSEWDVVEALRAQPQVDYAEPDTVLRIH